jgi:hypothetical protein
MDAIEKYQAAGIELKNAIASAERLVKIIRDGALVLQDWKRVMVSNAQVGFPAEVALTRSPSINASDWPTGQQLAEALRRYHNARGDLRRAYDAIPEAQRDAIRGPQSYEL